MNLKALRRYAAAMMTIAALMTVLVISGRKSRAVHRELTCSGIEVEFTDHERTSFVSREDVVGYIEKDYGKCSGKRLEELNLAEIEKVLDGRSAILKSEAYTTRDGKLHISISQRKPAVRLISGQNGWYADDTGFIFPLQKNYTSRVPIVDGNIPLSLTAGFKGVPAAKKEKEWLDGILGLANFLKSNRKWDDTIAQIHVEDNGHLILIPRKGRERFIFGRPEEFARKFGKIEDYYRFIVPEKGENTYASVNVSFDGQIVCRKQIN